MDPRVSVPSSAFISKSSARPSGLFFPSFGKSCRLSLSKMVPPLTRPCQGASLHSLIVGGNKARGPVVDAYLPFLDPVKSYLPHVQRNLWIVPNLGNKMMFTPHFPSEEAFPLMY